MAIYRCEVKPITRPQSIVAKIAYRTGEKIESVYTGEIYDYSRKGYIVHKEILLPPQAPDAYHDRAKLCNAEEMVNQAINAQLGKEILLSIPIELPLVNRIELIREYVKETLVSKGLCCDIAIHDPPVKDDKNRPVDKNGNPTNDETEMIFRNPHAHIVMGIRPLDEHGRWMRKSKTEYICINAEGQEKGLTADELKQTTGWQKQYKYIKADGTTQWLAKSVGEDAGYERVHRYPKQSKYGRQSDIMKYLSSPDFINDIRKAWEKYANKYLEKVGIQERIDHRSYADQGISRIPCISMDIQTINIEKRAERLHREGVDESKIVHSDIAKINNLIKQYNFVISKIERKIAELKDPTTKKAKQLENLREKIIFSRCQKKKLQEQSIKLEQDKETLQMKICDYEERTNLIYLSLKYHKDRAQELKNEIGSLSKLQFNRKSLLQKELLSETDTVKYYENKIEETNELYGYAEPGRLDEDKLLLTEAQKQVKDLDVKIAEINIKEKEYMREYMKIKSTIPQKDVSRVSQARLSFRSYHGGSVFGSLYNIISSNFDKEEEERRRRR